MMDLLHRIREQDYSRVHLFEIKSRRLCLDVNSARVARISDEAWEILHDFKIGASVAASRVGERAAGEIVSRIDAGNLFTAPVPYEAALDPAPRLSSAVLNLTHRCNLGCKYCFMRFPEVRERYGDSRLRMSAETGVRGIDFLHDHSDRGMSVNFFGGEPLLEFSLLKELVEYASKSYPDWFTFSITTNGTLLTREVADFLVEHDIGSIVSLDGHETAHDLLRPYADGRGSYNDIVRNLRHVLRGTSSVKVNVTYAGPTGDVLRAYRALREIGVRTLRFEKAGLPAGDSLTLEGAGLHDVTASVSAIAECFLQDVMDRQDVQVDNFTDVIRRVNLGEPRRRGCDVGVGYLAIASDGSVYPCHKMIGNQKFILGSVYTRFDRSFWEEVWHRTAESRGTCDSCWAKWYCAGRCVADNHFRSGGDLFEPDPDSCEIIKATIENGIWLEEVLRDESPASLHRLLDWRYVDPSFRPWRNPEARLAGRDPFTLELRSGRHQLNGLARTVWELCDGVNTAETIADRVRSRYPEADVRLVGDDVAYTLSTLVARGLIISVAAGPDGALRCEDGCK
jgi:uncharacterized protein